MMMFIGPRHSSGAHDFRAPLAWRAAMKLVFQEVKSRWTRGLLAQNPCAIGIQPVHTRVHSCGLRGLPPRGDALVELHAGRLDCRLPRLAVGLDEFLEAGAAGRRHVEAEI